jgi:hypothetical protein
LKQGYAGALLPQPLKGDAMITAWEDYLRPENAAAVYQECVRRCGRAFERQRVCIDHLLETQRPAVVACMGAGVLNDIPYWRLIDESVTVHLVDWLPGIVEFGIGQSIIRETPQGAYQCAYCRQTALKASDYCLSYREPIRAGHDVCAAFEASPQQADTCRAFRKGPLPHIHRQDVTGGYASAFGTALGDELEGVTTWRQALKRATAIAQRVKGSRTKLNIPDHSVNLVISSMVLSQFEHEPYGYFSRQAVAQLGLPTALEEASVRPSMEKLRALLLSNQIEGHCAEIERILALDGRCFFAFELFHREADTPHWYLVREMHDALARLAQHFAFDCDGIPEPVVDLRFEAASGRSAVYHFLLAPKQA